MYQRLCKVFDTSYIDNIVMQALCNKARSYIAAQTAQPNWLKICMGTFKNPGGNI